MDYKQFMEECKAACHERNACSEGYQMLLRSESVQEILLTVVRNWTDVWQSKYSDIVAKNIARWFDGLEREFHEAGIFVNEESDRGIVMLSNPGRTLRFTGAARVYLFGTAHVVATDHCTVYCRDDKSEVELYGRAYGKITAGRVSVHDRAQAESHQECTCYDSSKVYAFGGRVYDYGHLKLHTSRNVEIIKAR